MYITKKMPTVPPISDATISEYLRSHKSTLDSIIFDLNKWLKDISNAATTGVMILPATQILVGNSSGVAANVAMSDEATIATTGAVTLSNAAVIAKVLTGYTATSGSISATDSLLTAIQKLGYDKHVRSHTLLSTSDHSDVATYLNQALLTTSSPTFGNITDSGLTITRIPYASTAGLLIDSANLTFSGTLLYTTKLKTTYTTSSESEAQFGALYPIYISANDPTVAFNSYYTSSDGEWRYGQGSTAHFGANLGMDPADGIVTLYTSQIAGTADAIMNDAKIIDFKPDKSIVTYGAAVFNESGLDVDFRVESDTDANFFYLDGTGCGNMGVHTNSPQRAIHISYGNLRMDRVTAPTAPTLATGAAGVLTGAYYYRVTFVSAEGETEGGTVSAVVNPSSQKVELTNIPVSSAYCVTDRKIYRTVAGGGSDGEACRLVGAVGDNTTTTYSDNVADGALGVYCPSANSTGAQIYNEAGMIFHMGYNNTSIGYNSLPVNTGYRNTAIGRNTLLANSTGSNNIAIGRDAMIYNTTGGYNITVGPAALASNLVGSGNVAVGATALYNCLSDSNVGVGQDAGRYITSGFNNVFIGRAAGETTPQVNSVRYTVAVGSYAMTTGHYAVAIGYNSLAAANQIVLGNATNHTSFTIYGQGTLPYYTTQGILMNAATTGVISSNTAATAKTFLAIAQADVSGLTTASSPTFAGLTLGTQLFSVKIPVGSSGSNIWIGGGGQSSTYTSSSTGSYNTALGSVSLLSSTTGYNNTAIGYSCMRNLNTGYSNAGIGDLCLDALEDGYENVAIGMHAGNNAGTGVNRSSNNSVFVGYNTRPLVDSGVNEMVFGSNCTGRGSNTASWGNASIGNHYFSGTLNFVAMTTQGILMNAATTGIISSNTAATVKTFLAIAQADVTGLTTASSPAFAGLTLDTDTFFIDTTYHAIGIGTTNPHASSGSKMVVIPLSTTGAGVYTAIDSTNYVDSNFQIQISGSAATDKRAMIGSTTATDIVLMTNATERLRFYGANANALFAGSITSTGLTVNGNAGIGTDTKTFANGAGLVIYHADYPRLALKNSTSGTGAGSGFELVTIGDDAYFAQNEVQSFTLLGANGVFQFDVYPRIPNFVTPATASASGVKGDIKIDTDYIYICTATNTWKRAAIATW